MGLDVSSALQGAKDFVTGGVKETLPDSTGAGGGLSVQAPLGIAGASTKGLSTDRTQTDVHINTPVGSGSYTETRNVKTKQTESAQGSLGYTRGGRGVTVDGGYSGCTGNVGVQIKIPVAEITIPGTNRTVGIGINSPHASINFPIPGCDPNPPAPPNKPTIANPPPTGDYNNPIPFPVFNPCNNKLFLVTYDSYVFNSRNDIGLDPYFPPYSGSAYAKLNINLSTCLGNGVMVTTSIANRYYTQPAICRVEFTLTSDTGNIQSNCIYLCEASFSNTETYGLPAYTITNLNPGTDTGTIVFYATFDEFKSKIGMVSPDALPFQFYDLQHTTFASHVGYSADGTPPPIQITLINKKTHTYLFICEDDPPNLPPPPNSRNKDKPPMGDCCQAIGRQNDDLKKQQDQQNQDLALLKKQVQAIYNVLNPEEFNTGGTSVPKRLLYPGASGQESIKDYPHLFAAIIRQIDTATGYFPMEVTIADANPTKGVNQSMKLKINSLADGIKLVVQHLIETEGDTDATLNFDVRTAYTLVAMQQEVAKMSQNVVNIQDYLGYKVKHSKIKVPCVFNPFVDLHKGKNFLPWSQADIDNLSKKSLEEVIPKLLKERDIDVKTTELDEKKFLNEYLLELLRGVQACRGALTHEYKGEKALKEFLDLAVSTRQLGGFFHREDIRQVLEVGDMDNFQHDVEQGYAGTAQSADIDVDKKPYNKPPATKPRIKKVSKRRRKGR